MTGPDLKTLGLGAIGALAANGEPDADAKTIELEHLMISTAQLGDPAEWAGTLRARVDDPADDERTLTSLARHLHLTPVELLALRIALAVEEDALACRAVATLQAPIAGSHPSLGLLEHALRPFLWSGGERSHAINLCAELAGGNAIHSGALTLCATDAPLPERTVSVPARLVLALAGSPDRDAVNASTVALPEPDRMTAGRYARSLATDGGVLLIRGATSTEALAAACEVCAAGGKRPLRMAVEPAPGLAPVCYVRGAWPVLELDLSAGDNHRIAAIAGHTGPLIVTAGPDGHVSHGISDVLEWRLAPPDAAQRVALWQAHLSDARLASDLGRNYLHSASRIAEIAQRASHDVRMDGRDRVLPSDIETAAWSASSALLSGLTQPVHNHVTDTALVAGAQLKQELEFLVSRCRHREGLDSSLGETIRANYHRGVRALFVGPSGTGKTLAASWLATRLGIPLYRVDLSSIISKYIGETEKNLSAVLAQAESSDVILLFDEADSIFAKRTDVRDSNDRHANTQTNYLLQRIETYNGIVLLTSNSKSRFDKAFSRRLDSIIEFSQPTPDLRRAMWTSHLGDAHELSSGELNQLAVESNLAGGQIRNAVLGAAVLAGERRDRITFADVLAAVIDEYRKLGQQPPVSLIRHVDTSRDAAQSGSSRTRIQDS